MIIEKPLLLTLGEPGGIGPDLALKIWHERDTNKIGPFVFVASYDFVKERADTLGLTVPISAWLPDCENSKLSEAFSNSLPVLQLKEPIHNQPGIADPANGKAVLEAIQLSVSLIYQQKAKAIITNPINKKALYDIGFNHPGHTEFLGKLAEQWINQPCTPVMMLAGPSLRTVPATLHIALREVAETLRQDTLEELIIITEKELKRRFGIKEPIIVVAGLNPHAGEEGTMGREDIEIIQPAVENMKRRGIRISGPHPADTLFHAARRDSYDVAIAMYHDQALIPVKTLAFDETVNVTLGLPFIRTSPDHGTALDIAGQGLARADSLLAAINMADKMAQLDQGKNR